MLPLVASLSLSGCATHTETGAALGGLLGAGTGAALAGKGHKGTGALVGAGVGALAGGLVGASQDEAERKSRERIAAIQAQQRYIPPVEVVNMSRSGVPDDTIMTAIRTSGSVYHLTPTEISDLRMQGVSDNVVKYMLETARRPVVITRPVYVEPAPVIVEPPPPVIGVGFGYTRVVR
jgi:hypothetical protein